MGEHPAVITVGRGTQPENLLQPQCPVVEIERGGDVTYHAPGQLIVYPIRKLYGDERDLHQYLRNLEAVLIQTLNKFGIVGFQRDGLTGVWLKNAEGNEQKIASIGVAVRQWVTYHGIALNVNTDLSGFLQINPCGLDSTLMTSMAAHLNTTVSLNRVKKQFIHAYETVFNTRIDLIS